MQVKLISITPNAETNIVEIARVSSSRKDKSENPSGLINYLLNNKHFSPFEHSFLTMEIKTSKSIGIQLLRHRSFTFQEFSQRYAKVESIEPVELRYQAKENRQSSTDTCNPIISGLNNGEFLHASTVISEYFELGRKLYNDLLEIGVAKECARFVLPLATETTIYMTGNIRSWLGFLNLRLDKHAQKEIVDIAKEIANIMIKECPIISEALNNYNNFQGMFM